MKRSAGLFLLLAVSASSQYVSDSSRVGSIAKNRWLQPSGLVLAPMGTHLETGSFPMASALTPDGRYLLVLSGGYDLPTLICYRTDSMRETSRASLKDAWLGLAIHPGGKTVYVSGGSKAAIYEFTIDDGNGALEARRTFETVPEPDIKADDFVGDLTMSPDGRLIYAADLFHNRILVINPQSGRVIERWATGRRPYKILFHPDGKSYFVSSWADASVYQHETDTGQQISRTSAGPHPTAMLLREKRAADEEGEAQAFRLRLFVALANSNNVQSFGVTDNKEVNRLETINVGLQPELPAGMTPSALALSEDGNTLFVACSDANAIAAVNVLGARSRLAGFIPSGSYPTALSTLHGDRLAILNGYGSGGASMLNRGRGAWRAGNGSLSVVKLNGLLELDGWSDQVRATNPFREEYLYLNHRGYSTVIPAQITDKSAIEHVVYIVKDGLAYDQVLGDIGKGESSVSMAEFGAKVTPNHHKLANEFAVFDNFYSLGGNPAEGASWAAGAIASDYIRKLSPGTYAGRRGQANYELDPASLPAAGYIWGNASLKNLTVRNYGYFVANKPLDQVTNGDHVARVNDPALAAGTRRGYRGPDLEYLDLDRAKVFLAELAQMEASKSMPQFTLIRLANDRTSGGAAGARTRPAQVADNDYALGLIVEGLTHSQFWNKMAIFIVESDTGNGRDHVDAHRSPAFVVSPYAQRNAVNSTFYNTASVLRTMEAILGLRPMTMFDAGARPMLGVFVDTPDFKNYTAEKPNVPLDERTPRKQ